MIDIVVYERATGKEVDRIPCRGEQEANAVLRGIRINMSPDYRATSAAHRKETK
jgi:hypothetical protein